MVYNMSIILQYIFEHIILYYTILCCSTLYYIGSTQGRGVKSQKEPSPGLLAWAAGRRAPAEGPEWRIYSNIHGFRGLRVSGLKVEESLGV